MAADHKSPARDGDIGKYEFSKHRLKNISLKILAEFLWPIDQVKNRNSLYYIYFNKCSNHGSFSFPVYNDGLEMGPQFLVSVSPSLFLQFSLLQSITSCDPTPSNLSQCILGHSLHHPRLKRLQHTQASVSTAVCDIVRNNVQNLRDKLRKRIPIGSRLWIGHEKGPKSFYFRSDNDRWHLHWWARQGADKKLCPQVQRHISMSMAGNEKNSPTQAFMTWNDCAMKVNK